MGANFFVGVGESARWLGSTIEMDSVPLPEFLNRDILTTKSEVEFRRAVFTEFTYHDDNTTTPFNVFFKNKGDEAWFPEPDDYYFKPNDRDWIYCFVNGRTIGSGWRGPWVDFGALPQIIIDHPVERLAWLFRYKERAEQFRKTGTLKSPPSQRDPELCRVDLVDYEEIVLKQLMSGQPAWRPRRDFTCQTCGKTGQIHPTLYLMIPWVIRAEGSPYAADFECFNCKCERCGHPELKGEWDHWGDEEESVLYEETYQDDWEKTGVDGVKEPDWEEEPTLEFPLSVHS